VAINEIRDRGDDAFLVGAGYEQDGGILHGVCGAGFYPRNVNVSVG